MQGHRSYWLSKYALSDGIKAVDGPEPDCGGYVKPLGYLDIYKVGVEIHKTEAEAKAAAEKLRLKKLASLHKQIKALESKTF